MTDEDVPPEPNLRPLKPTTEQTIAVAIKGDPGKPGEAPRVIASGRGRVADEILRLAFEKGMKVREDADLAQLLAMLDLDTPIPSEAILAVAEILNRVYAANGRLLQPVSER